MADAKITELDENTTPVSTDLTVIVDDPGSTPATQKMTLDTLDDYLGATTKTLTNKTLTSPVIQVYDGWQNVNATWAYASATTITVPSGAASIYQKGDKIKLTQTTVKYFYIKSVADTVLTITGGTSYTLANAAISANYYSHIENPIGFPDWFSWTPALSYAGGSTDPDSVTINYAKFSIKGRTIYFNINGSVVRGSGDRLYLSYSLPINYAVASITAVFGFETCVVSTGNPVEAYYESNSKVSSYLGGAMTRNGYLSLSGFYEF